MNVVLLGHFDIASLVALDRIAAALPNDNVRVFLSSMAPDESHAHPAMRHLASVDGALCRNFLCQGSVAAALQEAGHLPQPNRADGLARLRDAAPDLILSIRYRRILHDAAIAIPTHGVINLHSGLLPDYRGVMATFWALLNGEREIGCTLHRIDDAGIDTGPVVAICRRPAEAERSYLWNVLSLYAAGCGAMLAAVRRLRAGKPLAEQRQMPAGGAYYSAPDASAVDRFLAGGGRLADGGETDHPFLSKSDQ